MKKIILNLILIYLLLFNITSVSAEQYLLSCKIKISAVTMDTNEIMREYVIDRYFIIDTILEGVFDANNEPLYVNNFTQSEIIFSKKASSFADVVDTKITYNRNTHQIKLNEIYAYASKFDQRARFVTKGEGNCSETKIDRKPLF